MKTNRNRGESITRRRSWECLLVVQSRLQPWRDIGEEISTDVSVTNVGRICLFTRPTGYREGPFNEGWHYWGNEFRALSIELAPESGAVLSYDFDTGDSGNPFTASQWIWKYKNSGVNPVEQIRLDTIKQFSLEVWPVSSMWGSSAYFRDIDDPGLNMFQLELQKGNFTAVRDLLCPSTNDLSRIAGLAGQCCLVMTRSSYAPPEGGDPWFYLQSSKIDDDLILRSLRSFQDFDVRFYVALTFNGLCDWLLSGKLPRSVQRLR